MRTNEELPDTVLVDFPERFGNAPIDQVWCGSPLVGQEDVTCWRELEHSGNHESIVCWPPCPACGGLDMHRSGCADTDRDTENSKVVQWCRT